MNTKQIALIHSSFEQLAPAAEQLAAAFYRRLFELDPTLQPLFQPCQRMDREPVPGEGGDPA